MRKFWEKVKDWLGMHAHTDYVRDYFMDKNMHNSVYMSIVVIVLETWMILSLSNYLMHSDKERDALWLFVHYGRYAGLLLAAVLMLLCAKKYTEGKRKNRRSANLMKWVFVLSCIAFGIYFSLSDYAEGEQILTFLTMELFTGCLLIWRPWVSFLLLSGSFLLFYVLCGMQVPASYSFQVNLFTMWLATFLASAANYGSLKKEAEQTEHLAYQANYDTLTGLKNMRSFFKEVGEIRKADLYEDHIFLFFDVENFKSYNEKYGLEAGNVFLKQIGQKLQNAFPEGITAHYSDDHFVIYTVNADVEERVEALADQILKDAGGLYIALKCGGYAEGEYIIRMDAALDRARIAAESLKKQYEKDYQEYTADMEQEFAMKQYVMNHIDEAVEKGYIKTYYQPVVSLEDGKPAGLEALARWEDPVYGLLPPGQFIATLEEYRQIHKVDLAVVENVCRDYQEAKVLGLRTVPVSLNLSRLDFELCDMLSLIEEMRKKYDVPASYLDIEITESALSEKTGILRDTMSLFKHMGYKLWLDDFGSGYSSMNVLKDYSFDVLKIDMAFLKGFGSNVNVNVILKSVVEMAQNLKMISLCEGVETEEQYAYLKEIGCDRAQGYLFSEPLPIEELRKKMDFTAEQSE